MSEKVLFRIVLIGFIVFVFGAILEMVRMPEVLKGGYITQMERVIMEGNTWKNALAHSVDMINHNNTRIKELEQRVHKLEETVLSYTVQKELDKFEGRENDRRDY